MKKFARGFHRCVRLRLFLLALWFLPLMAFAQFNYTVANGGATITGYTGPGGAVTIPSTLAGFPVTAIGNVAFNSKSSITSVTIPNSVTTIGDAAFSQCPNLVSVTIPSSVVSIGGGTFLDCYKLSAVTLPNGLTSLEGQTFERCYNLTNITFPPALTHLGLADFYKCTNLLSVSIPASVTFIGDIVFTDCSRLTNISVAASNPNYSSLDGVMFNKNQTRLIFFPAGRTGSYTVPSTVTFVWNSAFEQTSLSSLVIPDSVKDLGFGACTDSLALTNVVLGKQVRIIDGFTFDGCEKLTSIIVPTNITSVGQYAFSYCTSLTNVTFLGAAPAGANDLSVFDNAPVTMVFYFQGMTGWSNSFGGAPTHEVPMYLVSSNANTITITQYVGSLSELIIPSLLNGLPVTGIGNGAFFKATNLVKIITPTVVTNLGSGIFQSCSNLSEATITGLAPALPDAIFQYCPSLVKLTLPDSITNVGSGAFRDCLSLSNLSLPPLLQRIDSDAFNNCTNLRAVFCLGNAPSGSADVSIFANATNAIVYYLQGTTGWGLTFGGRPTQAQIIYYVSTNNSQISITAYTGSSSSLTVPSTLYGLPVTDIGWYAFQNASNLTSIILPNTLKTIGNYAFQSAPWLTNVVVPDGVTSIGTSAFAHCPRLGSVSLPNTVTNLADGVFAFSALTDITLPSSLVALSNGLFSFCTALSSVTLPSGLRIIGDAAFGSCSALNVLSLPQSVTNIGNSAFNGCSSLSFLGMSTNVITFGAGAFASCSQLPFFAMPSGVKTISSQLFQNCVALTNFTVPNGITSIGSQSFMGCKALRDIAISSTVTNVGDSAFSSCSNLVNLTLPNSLKMIGNSAFSVCSRLTNVFIPEGVSSIGTSPFGSCTNLVMIDVAPANLFFTSANGVLFDKNVTRLIQYPPGRVGDYAIPNTVTNIGLAAFTMSLQLGSVTIASSVRSISGSAFSSCANLKSLYFQGNAPAGGSDVTVLLLSPFAKVYYLPNTTGWASLFSSHSTTLWNAQPVIANGASNFFKINLTGTFNLAVVVETSTNLTGNQWIAISTNTVTNGAFFIDNARTNFATRYYRLRSP